jgi:hypothetical protein
LRQLIHDHSPEAQALAESLFHLLGSDDPASITSLVALTREAELLLARRGR